MMDNENQDRDSCNPRKNIKKRERESVGGVRG